MNWYDKNKEYKQHTNREYLRKNKEEIDKYQKEYYANNKDKFKEYNQQRQHKNHNISKEQWEYCKQYFNNSCCYCGLPIEDHYIVFNGESKLGDFHKEHLDDEGVNDLSNCVPSCKNCNSYKWKFKFEDWYSPENPIYDIKRYDRIIKWINKDYKEHIEK